jgi:hypothetical protein
MAINDILSGTLEMLGLKKSEVRKLQDEIEGSEARIRELYDSMENHIGTLRTMENQLRSLREKYEASSNAVKDAYAQQIRLLLSKMEKSKEQRDLIAREIKAKEDVLHNQKIKLENLLHPTQQDDIDELAEDKRDILKDIKEEDSALDKLNDATYRPSAPMDQVSETEESKIDHSQLEKELESILGNSTDKTEENKTKSGKNSSRALEKE